MMKRNILAVIVPALLVAGTANGTVAKLAMRQPFVLFKGL
ncbi:hypothetical protein, partial [Escherichia coli]